MKTINARNRVAKTKFTYCQNKELNPQSKCELTQVPTNWNTPSALLPVSWSPVGTKANQVSYQLTWHRLWNTLTNRCPRWAGLRASHAAVTINMYNKAFIIHILTSYFQLSPEWIWIKWLIQTVVTTSSHQVLRNGKLCCARYSRWARKGATQSNVALI